MKPGVEDWIERGEHDLEAAQLSSYSLEETRQMFQAASELIEKIKEALRPRVNSS
jgi:hypothetical protein